MEFSLPRDIAIFVAGLIIGPAGYLLKRRIEHRADHESLERTERLLRVNREMKDQNLTAGELQKLELTLKRGESNTGIQTATAQLLEAKSSENPHKVITQLEMNRSSYEDFEKAELMLEQAVRRLQSILDGASLEELEASQAAWKGYRDKQVAFAGGFYRGGSIAPLIRNSEAAALTYARANEIAAVYDELQSR
jgi:uncharacterized protein YecT (DUF1311 family)